LGDVRDDAHGEAPVIGVVGEALIDLIVQPDGDFRPHLGGSPYNVARALEAALLSEGVTLPAEHRSGRPTSLAVVEVDDAGQPSYSLYREGIADRDVTLDALLERLPPGMTALHTGSLALVPDDLPRIRGVFEAARERGARTLVDVNARPFAIGDLDAWRAGVRALLPLCDLIKLSDEDIEALAPGADPLNEAEAIRRACPSALVAVTGGSEGAWLLSDAGRRHAPVYDAGPLVDTVGAGDCFQAGLIAALHASGALAAPGPLAALDPTSLDAALHHAAATAALDVVRAGCDPPAREAVLALLHERH
jgi:fructokinase